MVVSGQAPVINGEGPTLAATQDANMLEYKVAQDFNEDDAQIQAMFTPGADAGAYRTFFGGKYYETQMTGDGMIGATERMSGPPDSYSEIKTIAVLAPAEYAQPYNVDAITKGGTNNFHGAYGYVMSNPHLNARGPFDPAPVPPSKTSLIQQIEIGGPAWIPRLYNGRQKTYFYFSRSSQTLDQTSDITQNVPTDAFKQGDFSSIGALTNGQVAQIIDPLSGKPFPDNVIPASRIVGPAKTIQAIFPTASNQNSLLNNVVTAGINSEPSLSQQIFRVDQKVTNKDNTFFIWQRWNSLYVFDASLTCGTYFGCGGALGGGFSDFIQPHDHNLWELAWTRAITPRAFNEFKFGVSRFITPE